MPDYTWYGIDIEGKTCRGNLYVHSLAQLQQILFKRDIALISSSVRLPWFRLKGPSQARIIAFCDALATLLDAGVFLDFALELLSKKSDHKGFQLLTQDIRSAVNEGISCAEALGAYKEVFGTCALELIASGEQVGKLPQALRIASGYYSQQDEYAKRIRGVLLMPVITGSFFIVVAWMILAYVVPVFASMFIAAHKEVPWITRMVLTMSNWCTIRFLLSVAVSSTFCLIGIKAYLKKPYMKKVKDRVLLQIPFLGSLLYTQSIYQFLQAAGMLVNGGIHELPALQAASTGIHNEYIRCMTHVMVNKIQQGHSFKDTLDEVPLDLIEEVRAIIVVGEESATLGSALEHGARVYKQELERKLQILSSLVQPCLMVVLGIFITVLIFAVYMPVLQLSYVIM